MRNEESARPGALAGVVKSLPPTLICTLKPITKKIKSLCTHNSTSGNGIMITTELRVYIGAEYFYEFSGSDNYLQLYPSLFSLPRRKYSSLLFRITTLNLLPYSVVTTSCQWFLVE